MFHLGPKQLNCCIRRHELRIYIIRRSPEDKGWTPQGKNIKQLICPQQISYLDLPIDVKKEIFIKSKLKYCKQPYSESYRCRVLDHSRSGHPVPAILCVNVLGTRTTPV